MRRLLISLAVIDLKITMDNSVMKEKVTRYITTATRYSFNKILSVFVFNYKPLDYRA